MSRRTESAASFAALDVGLYCKKSLRQSTLVL